MPKNFTKIKGKALIAMSGGVDSSVAAALLKKEGYEVIGATMSLFSTTSTCCGISACHDAKRVCDILGVPHYTLNFKKEFKKKVIDNFVEEYKQGRTPNPCIRCNEHIKFDLLLKKAKAIGADYIATGHYANIMTNDKCQMSNNRKNYILKKGKDKNKDQSYALYTLKQEQLKRTLFPLGKLTKQQVRALAKKLKLPVADKPESQEICFIEDDNYGRFLKENIPQAAKPGPILDTAGKVVGKHPGIIFYTIGQRKGIGAHTERKYVVKIDVAHNAIIIGNDDDLKKKELTASNLTFVSGKTPVKPIEVKAKIRYNSTEAPAVLKIINVGTGPRPRGSTERLVPVQKAIVKFRHPQRAITPGQSVVFYKGDEVIGGGIIRGGVITSF